MYLRIFLLRGTRSGRRRSVGFLRHNACGSSMSRCYSYIMYCTGPWKQARLPDAHFHPFHRGPNSRYHRLRASLCVHRLGGLGGVRWGRDDHGCFGQEVSISSRGRIRAGLARDIQQLQVQNRPSEVQDRWPLDLEFGKEWSMDTCPNQATVSY